MRVTFQFIISLFFSAAIVCYGQVNNYTPQYSFFSINDISTPIYNDGKADVSPFGNSGFIYPKGSNRAVFYQTSLLWGGKVGGEIRVGGTAYRSGIIPGRILTDNSTDNPNSVSNRVYRVRPDYLTADFKSEISRERKTFSQIYNQYEKDWNEWPAEWGAPYEDIDKNGSYNPETDIPGFSGADQTLWYVANDSDADQTEYLYGSQPMGIEIQVTVWGYNRIGHLNNILFKKYKIINKSSEKFNEMHFSFFVDNDLGDASDDLVGCDTLLNLGFAYNHGDYDAQYENNPPAAGVQLLQGPVVAGSQSDYAIYSGERIPFKKNLGMTAFFPFMRGPFYYWYPRQGEYKSGTLAWYNYFQGKLGPTGEPFRLPKRLGGEITSFVLTGDPVKETGWIDGIDWYPGNRQFNFSTGPFEIMPGDTQEVIIAQIAAGAFEGCSSLGSVGLLKLFALEARSVFKYNFDIPHELPKPDVSASPFDRTIILKWGNNLDASRLIENYDKGGYKFQGYHIYQLPLGSMNLKDAQRIATYDLADGMKNIYDRMVLPETGIEVLNVLQLGRDSGIERYINIEEDYIKKYTLLNNGTRYNYAVTAYYYNDDLSVYPNTLESDPSIISAMPESVNPGKRYEAKFGERISVHPYSSNTDIDVMIIDPSQLTGHDYEITFHESSGQLLWNLEDITSGSLKLTDQTNITGTDEYYIVDGFRIIITQDTSSQLTGNDVFTFTTHAVTQDEELAKLDVEKINVFPNPYYGGHGNELNQYHNYVMFNHLPQRVTFRIFNLAGHLVRTLYKDDDTQFYLWDLQNENRLQAPSGLYIIYIEMPDLQKVKVLKLAIVQREVVPGNF